MNRIEVARKVTFDDPATFRFLTVRQLKFHGADGVVYAAFWPEPIGETMEVAFPNGLHDH